MGFLSLQHKSGLKIHSIDRLPTLPSLRLQGLDTLLTFYSLQTLVSHDLKLTALLGFSPPEFTLPARDLAASPQPLAHLLFLPRLI
jgi:hypothetical protein